MNELFSSLRTAQNLVLSGFVFEIFDSLFSFIFCITVLKLKFADKLIFLSRDLSDIVVSEFPPLLFNASF